MSGTDIAYRPTICYAMSGTGIASGAIGLRARYALSGNGIGSCATRKLRAIDKIPLELRTVLQEEEHRRYRSTLAT